MRGEILQLYRNMIYHLLTVTDCYFLLIKLLNFLMKVKYDVTFCIAHSQTTIDLSGLPYNYLCIFFHNILGTLYSQYRY